MKLEIQPENGASYDVLFAASPSHGKHLLAFKGITPTNVSLTGGSFSFVVNVRNDSTNSGAVSVKVFMDGVESGSAKGTDMVAGWFKPISGAKTVSIHGQ